MQMTLLDMVQDILSDMDSDDVNSISDTVESMQVARIVKSTYFSIVDERQWPIFNQLFQLESLADTNHPTTMKLPDNIARVDNIHFVRYNKKQVNDTYDKYSEIKYMPTMEFIDFLGYRHSDSSTIQVVDINGLDFNIINNKHPSYYTSFDDTYLVFDAFDSAVDQNLQQSKTKCYGKIQPQWSMVDEFIPVLPLDAFSYLLNESKSTCSMKLKQAPDQKAEQNSISLRRRMSQDGYRMKRGIERPDFGRKNWKWHSR